MGRGVVITGAGAGVGRATAEEFARAGYDVGLLSRDPARLDRAVDDLNRKYGVHTMAIPTDVADADAVEHAASDIERHLGPIEVWVNVAMATVFALSTSSPRKNSSGRTAPACLVKPNCRG